jgi:hypothetical protein
MTTFFKGILRLVTPLEYLLLFVIFGSVGVVTLYRTLIFLSLLPFTCFWLSLRLPEYRRPAKSTENQARHADIDTQNRNLALVFVTVCGAISTGFLGFGKHLFHYPFPTYTHGDGWEVSALVWTIIFVVYYIVKFQTVENSTLNKFVALGAAFLSLSLFFFAFQSLNAHRPIVHVLCVCGIGVALLSCDWFMARKHKDESQRAAFARNCLIADAPPLVGFLVLLAYIGQHPDAESPEVFISGIIAAQLWISNVIFVVSESEILLRIGSSRRSSGEQLTTAPAIYDNRAPAAPQRTLTYARNLP